MTPDPTAAHTTLPLGLLEHGFASTLVTLPSGARVAMRVAGPANAPVVVLLHGIGSGAASWLHCAVALATRWRVLAWDAPGYGDSTALAAPRPHAVDYAERLHECLAAMQVDRCVLVGHSLGALMAAACAAGPGRGIVQRLVLISPARGYGAPEQAATREQVRETRLHTLHRLGVATMAKQAPLRMLSAQAGPAARAWVEWNAARLSPAGYTQAVHMLCDDDIARYTGLAMPVEVHCGDADIVTPPDACRAVAERFAAPYAPIAQAGHASAIEQPELVARLIAQAAAPHTTTIPRGDKTS